MEPRRCKKATTVTYWTSSGTLKIDQNSSSVAGNADSQRTRVGMMGNESEQRPGHRSKSSEPLLLGGNTCWCRSGA